ncbi:hypothetical protein [Nitratireductor luteus]|uniref:hypothetical protein n=1 Tax=Nitratireductor luteus TaxID=2976980 RepID=UPI00223E9D77|nr:hypothetical protein [Nitratireductor luteus]
MARWILRLMIAAAVAGTPLAAQAQGLRCGQRGDIVSYLGELFNEKQHGYGIVGNRAIIELFVSPRGTWSILVSRTDKQTCIVAAGHGWESAPVLEGHEATLNIR